jgi:ABC-2 type transport system ATP-binding protein
MSDNIAIKVDGVNKSFKLPHEKVSSIKSVVVNFYKINRTFEKQEVLKDISFEIKKGEFFGIVGRNGSGKSTLLKLLAGIYTPDSGHIHVNGKLTPFIELGVGFSPELTGRENVFLNGALLGFSRNEMEKMYNEIVDFAELERFMDQKLKNYSSGMQVRLAFSIAIRANTGILILDEVLAVGDASFQQKCYDYFNELKKQRKTVVLVTHDMSAVSRFCDRALYLANGKKEYIGPTREVADMYLEANYNTPVGVVQSEAAVKPRATIEKVEFVKTKLDIGEKLKARISFENSTALPIHFGFQLFGKDGSYCFGSNTYIGGLQPTSKKKGTLEFTATVKLVPGVYFVNIATMDEFANKTLDYRTNVGQIVVNKTTEVGGIAYLDHSWELL